MDNDLKPPEAPELQALQQHLDQAREKVRKRELEIAALENLSQAVFSQAQEALVACDHRNRITRASQAAHRLAGKNPLGLLFHEAFPLEMKISGKHWRYDQQPGCFSLTEALAGESSEGEEAILCREDGQVFQVRVTAGPLQDGEGIPQGCLVTLIDITAQKQAEENLRQANGKIEALLQASPLPIVSLDFDGRVEVWNRAAEKLFGWNKDEVLGQVIPTIPPERQGEMQELLHREKSGETLSTVETQRVTRDGRLVDISLHTGLIHDGKGEIAGAIAILEDITARKQAETRIARYNAVLAGINEVFRQALTCETEEELGQTCLEVAEKLTGSRFGFICEVNEAGRFDTIAISDPGWSACKIPIAAARELLYDVPVCGIRGKVVAADRSLLCNDPASHPDYVFPPEGHPPITSFLGVPLKQAGKAIGLVALGNKPGGYETADQEAVEALAVAIVEALQRRRMENRLQKKAGVLNQTVRRLEEVIAQHRHTEETLLRQAELLDLANDAIIVRDLNSRVLFWSRGARETYGWTQEAARGQVTHKLFRTRFPISQEAVDQALLEHGRWEGELVHNRVDGATIVVASKQAIRRNEAGEPAAILEINRDITPSKHVERALRRARHDLGVLEEERVTELENTVAQLEQEVEERRLIEASWHQEEARLRLALNAARAGIWEWDLRTDENYWSEELWSLFGLTPHSVQPSYEAWLQAVHPDDRLRVEEAVKKAASQGIALEIEWRMQHPDGSVSWLISRGQPQLDDRGQALSYLGIIMDITARQEIEEALHASNAELQAALESMTDAVFISDVQGRFIKFNEAFATFHKFKNKDECPKTLAEYPAFLDVFMDNGELAPLEKWAVPRALRGETAANAEYALRRKDTGATWVGSYSFAPIRDKNGEIVGSVVVGRDITDRKRVEEALEASEENLRFLTSRLLTAQEDERQRIAHELHDDLGQSLMLLKLQLSGLGRALPEELEKPRQQCAEAVENVQEIINSVRRLSQDLIPPALKDVGLKATLKELVDEFCLLHDLDCSLDLVETKGLFPTVMELNLYRIVQESLTNIGKYAQATEVKVSLKRKDHQVWLSVEDNGKGFEVDDIMARRGRDKGLGLTSLAERARLTGGTLHLWSQPGEGTKVHITVPLKTEALG